MAEMDYSGLLPQLKFNLREDSSGNCEGCDHCGDCHGRTFTDKELLTLLEKHRGNVNAASYEGLLIKAEEDSVSLPDGLDLPSAREYWLNLARLYRPCMGHNIPRADAAEVR